jgi:hypothetical protein
MALDHEWYARKRRIEGKRAARRTNYANRVRRALVVLIKNTVSLDVIFESRIVERSNEDEDSVILISVIDHILPKESNSILRVRFLLRKDECWGRVMGMYTDRYLPPVRNNNRPDGRYYRDEDEDITRLIADAKIVVEKHLASSKK